MAYLQEHQIPGQSLLVSRAHDCQVEVDYGEIGRLVASVLLICGWFLGHSDQS